MRGVRAIAVMFGLGATGLNAQAIYTGAPLGIVEFDNTALPPSYRLLEGTEAARAAVGQSVFDTRWVASGANGSTGASGGRVGLGPLYNASACATCHPGGSRATGPAGSGEAPIGLEIQLAKPGGTGAGDPVYGHVFNTSAVGQMAAEGTVAIRYTENYGYYYPDGSRWRLRTPHYELTHLSHGPLAPTTVIKPRLAPALFGVGLLEAVPWAAFSDKPGVLGRFGWQEAAVSVRDQTTRAFSRELGVTSSDHPEDDCTSAEIDCASQAEPIGAPPEVSEELLTALVAFVQGLAVPGASHVHPKNARLGSELFVLIGCGDCHRSRLPVELPAKGGAPMSGSIAAYTDLRLHDLGMDMADENASGAKVPSKWRTAPLWGFGYRLKTESQPTFLHDGRARTPEEAVLWHSGEAAGARRKFTELGPRSRAALLHWLETL